MFSSALALNPFPIVHVHVCWASIGVPFSICTSLIKCRPPSDQSDPGRGGARRLRPPGSVQGQVDPAALGQVHREHEEGGEGAGQ